MITPFQLYLIVKLDSICECLSSFSNGFWGFSVFFIVAMGFFMLFRDDVYKLVSKTEQEKELIWLNNKMSRCYTCVKTFFILGIVLKIIVSFLPSTKEMAAIYVIPKVANSQFVNETFPNELKEIYGMSKDWMKEFLKSKKETVETAITTVVSNKVQSVKQ
jgi:hypothetical protein